MFATYVVNPRSGTLQALADAGTDGPAIPTPSLPASIAGKLTGVIRDYYVAAEVELWDYTTPGGEERCRTFADESGVHAINVSASAPHGSRFYKARYVGYTDATFTTRLPASVETAHLGILGPVLRAVVGDTIRVTFLNRTPRPLSLHPHGVVYRKGSEGAPYADGTYKLSDTGDDAVPGNGSRWVYHWFVPDSAGPGPRDLTSVLWLWHGHTHEVSDENLGILGGILITGRGQATSATNLRPRDVDREFILLAKAFNEDQAAEGGSIGHTHPSDGHESGRLWHTLNGKVFCGLAGLMMQQGERVRWYLAALGESP